MVVIPPPPAVSTFETINPANGNVLATVSAAGREDLESRGEKCPAGAKNLGVDDRDGAARVFCVGPWMLCVNAIDRTRKTLETLDTGKAHLRKPQPSISLPVRTCGSIAGLIPALEAAKIRCVKRPLCIPAANRWA